MLKGSYIGVKTRAICWLKDDLKPSTLNLKPQILNPKGLGGREMEALKFEVEGSAHISIYPPYKYMYVYVRI